MIACCPARSVEIRLFSHREATRATRETDATRTLLVAVALRVAAARIEAAMVA